MCVYIVYVCKYVGRDQHMLAQFTSQAKNSTLQTFLHKRNRAYPHCCNHHAGPPYRQIAPLHYYVMICKICRSSSAKKSRHRVWFNINGHINKILPLVKDEQTSKFIQPCACVTYEYVPPLLQMQILTHYSFMKLYLDHVHELNA
jgi:hypothetical protein